MSEQGIIGFREVVWDIYRQQKRDTMPWRIPDTFGDFDPYKIMVSEIMLQQTQVSRVLPKYEAFIMRFPTVRSLADAELGEVLRMWQGLGYNRRAKFLWQAATMIIKDFHGSFPRTITELVNLPGIGKNTAGAIIAYTWSEPVIYIETNIRTVFIYHFFKDIVDVSDADILTLVTDTMPRDDAEIREWYWALMDYGAYLKRTKGNLSKLSKVYVKQSAFHGSLRQIRGAVIKELTQSPKTLNMLSNLIADERLPAVLGALEQEMLIRRTKHTYHL